MNKIICYTDGASRGNPGLASAGAVIFQGESVLAEIRSPLGVQTNNCWWIQQPSIYVH